MVGRWLRTVGVLVAMLAPGQVAWAQALPDLPPPPPPQTPPPPPPGLRPVVGTNGVTTYVIDMPAPPPATVRPDNLPPVIMRHLTSGQNPGLPPVPGALPLPAGQTPAAAPGNVAPPPLVVPPQPDKPSTLPQTPPPSNAPVPAPPPTEGGRRPGGPRGI
jgi:hypothetical protein